MTLEEAIYKEEALAYSFGERYKRMGEPVGDLPELEAEHSQYAEWLRELNAYRDGCHCDTCKYLDKNIKNRPCGYCGDNESKWQYGGKR